MEEADALGDKIAIMENGELISYGTSMFLKKEYGNGYTLKILKANEKFSSDQVLDVIAQFMPRPAIKESVESLLCIVLPYEQQKKYVDILKALEQKKGDLNIESIGISNTTLEEVFLK
jgi:ATP-binding cassette, subfamily A (ABC1), member 3